MNYFASLGILCVRDAGGRENKTTGRGKKESLRDLAYIFLFLVLLEYCFFVSQWEETTAREEQEVWRGKSVAFHMTGGKNFSKGKIVDIIGRT